MLGVFIKISNVAAANLPTFVERTLQHQRVNFTAMTVFKHGHRAGSFNEPLVLWTAAIHKRQLHRLSATLLIEP
jgi:hypothetical protein